MTSSAENETSAIGARRMPLEGRPAITTRRRPLRQRLRLPLMLAGPILVLLAAGYWYLTSGRYVSTDNAYVQAARVVISADVSGLATMPRHELRPIIAGVMLAMLLAALDQTVVGPALPTIGRELGDFHAIAWVVTAYLLSATAVTPIYGKLSDLYGRRELLLVGIALFAVGSLLCALAPSMLLLIAARALQGAGGGGLISLANTVVADVISPRDRGRYQGYFASVFATASIAGPVLGGFLTQHLSWTMIFWIGE